MNTNNVEKLLGYLTEKCKENIGSTHLFNKDTIIKESDFNILLNQIDTESVNPIYIMILSIYYLEQIIKKGIIINESSKFNALWITFLLSCKYVLYTDSYVSMEHLSNLGGYTLEEYIKLERKLLINLDYKLEIPKNDFNRLKGLVTGLVVN